MPVIRLLPSSTVSNDGTVVGGFGAPAHVVLSDGSDSSYLAFQTSQFEPTKLCRGDLTDLPDGVGVVTATVINVRARIEPPIEGSRNRLSSGEYPNARLTNTLTEAITWYSVGVDYGELPATINGLQYMAGVQFVSSPDGGVSWVYEINFDVSYEFVSGVTVAMIFQWLGPLVAVGLNEMPRLSLELWRRAGVYLRPHELEPAWRELREDRARRYHTLGVGSGLAAPALA